MRILLILQAIVFLIALAIVLRVRKRPANPSVPASTRQRVERGLATTVWTVIVYMLIVKSLMALISD